MHIKIKNDAAQAYSDRNWFGKGANRRRNPQFSLEWMKTLEAIQDTWINVELKYLFKNQYNTVPIEGVSDKGLRIHDDDVAEIDYQDDTIKWLHEGMRSGVLKCHSLKLEHISSKPPCQDMKDSPVHYITIVDAILSGRIVLGPR